jgi:hypothetical protein
MEMGLAIPAARTRRLSSPRSRRLAFGTLFLAALALALVARRPDALAHPQFYAEDGASWFADAYNLPPARALLSPLAGYYTFFQRAMAFLVAPLGIDRAPAAFAVIGFGMQLLPAAYFISSRMRPVVQSDSARLGLAALYVMIPARELGGNLTNTQWDLMILAFLVIFAAPPVGWSGRVFDLGALVLSGLTGPYALFLLPIAAIRWRARLTKWRSLQIAVLAGCCAVQLGIIAYLHLHGSSRTSHGLGGSAGDVAIIIVNQVLAAVSPIGLTAQTQVLAFTLAIGIVLILVMAATRGPDALRWFTILAACLAISGMASPYDAKPTKALWLELMGGGGARYFYALILALAFSLTWLAFHTSRRAVATPTKCLLAGLCLLTVGQWQFTAYSSPGTHPVQYGKVLGKAPEGATVTIPINPKGWTMTLVKR